MMYVNKRFVWCKDVVALVGLAGNPECGTVQTSANHSDDHLHMS